MLGRLAELAQSAKAKAVDAVSSVDLTSVKGALASTVDTVKSTASNMADGVGERMTHPADAYDKALDDVQSRVSGMSLEMGRMPNLDVVIKRIKDENPYR